MSDLNLLPGKIHLQITDFNQDGSLANNVLTGDNIVVMLQGKYCGYCTKAKPEYMKLNNMKFMTVQTDSPDEGEKQAGAMLMQKHKIQGVPAFIKFSKQGKYVGQHSGGRDANSLQQFAQ